MGHRIVITWIAALVAGCSSATTAPSVQLVPPPAVSLSIAVGSALVVETPAAEHVRDLDERERREQVRDWAVLALIGRLSTSPEQAAAATYELPQARLPYLDELYAFEYGRGRRAYLADRVLLFRDADDPEPEVTIARLADRVRMENGEIPRKVEVYLVTDRRDTGEIAIERAPDLAGDALFSPEYGYVRGEGSDPEKLAAWLAAADDLSFAQVTHDGRLVLGGRRFARHRTPNLKLEDVAALYQAHDKLGTDRADARAQLASLPPAARRALDRMIELAGSGKLTELSEVPGMDSLSRAVPAARLDRFVHAAQVMAAPPPSPGFSLDPQWLPSPEDPKRPLLRDNLRRFAADPCGELKAIAQRAKAVLAGEPDATRRTWRGSVAAEVDEVSAALGVVCHGIPDELTAAVERAARALDSADPKAWPSAVVPFYELSNRLKRSHSLGASTVGLALHVYDAESQVQCARYEGLSGTRVGMTLFYTDLVAKLWGGTDYALSAPVLEIPGFLTLPRIDLPVGVTSMAAGDTATRLWFGPRSAGVSRVATPGGTTIAFDHQFTRVYAAGDDPTQPGVEQQPPEDSRRFLNWWDRHYDAVADYEPEYHLQNQIMKWTMVGAVLAASPVGRALHDVHVASDLRFDSWLRSNRAGLRFIDDLPVAPNGIPGKECIPLLASYDFKQGEKEFQIYGGVSTVAREAAEAMEAVNVAKPLGARRPFLADLGQGTAGTATRAHAVLDAERVAFADAERVPTVGAKGVVKLGQPVVKYERSAASEPLVIRASGDKPISQLSVRSLPGEPAPGRPGRIRLDLELGGPEGEPLAGAVRRTVDEADAAMRGGKLYEAARIYEDALPAVRSAGDVPRLAAVDIARDRPASLLAKLEQLEKAPSATGNDILLAGLDRNASPAVARRVHAMIEHRAPLSGDHEVMSVVNHRLAVTRDITAAQARTVTRRLPASFDGHHVYIDDRVLAARDGLIPDLGGHVARWHRIRGVQITELESSAIGALPDRLHLPDGLALQRADKVAQVGKESRSSRVFLIRQCGPPSDDRERRPDDRARLANHGC